MKGKGSPKKVKSAERLAKREQKSKQVMQRSKKGANEPLPKGYKLAKKLQDLELEESDKYDISETESEDDIVC